MRKIHRWLAVFFAPFLLWIGATGFMIDIIPMLKPHRPPPPAQAAPASAPVAADATAAPFQCPSTMICKPRFQKQALSDRIRDLHSGEKFGFPGKLLSLISGLALLFFSFSGLWMYIQMWRNRARRSLTPRWFW